MISPYADRALVTTLDEHVPEPRVSETRAPETHVYEPPRITRLGTLAELTQGGTDTISDGVSGAGDQGSV